MSIRNQLHGAPLNGSARGKGNTDCGLVDMYSVFQNRLFLPVNDIGPGSTRSVKANA